MDMKTVEDDGREVTAMRSTMNYAGLAASLRLDGATGEIERWLMLLMRNETSIKSPRRRVVKRTIAQKSLREARLRLRHSDRERLTDDSDQRARWLSVLSDALAR